MKAMITLLRAQRQLMRGVAATFLVSVALLWVLPNGPDIGLAAILWLLLIVVAGAYIFGAEYSEGAADYLSTRPTGTRQIFVSKLIALAVLSAAIGIGLAWAWEWPWPIALLATVFCLDLALWYAGAAILLKDTIRALLYGTASLAILGACLYFGWNIVFANAYTIAPTGEVVHWNRLANRGFLLAAFLLLLSPALLAPLVSLLHQGERFQRPVLAKVPLIILGLAVVCSGYTLSLGSHEGETSVYSLHDNDETLGKEVDGNTLRFVQTNWDSLTRRHVYRVSSIEWTDPHAPVVSDIVLDSTVGHVTSSQYYPFSSALLNGNQVALFRQMSGFQFRSFNTNGPGIYKPTNTFSRKEGLLEFNEEEDGNLSFELGLFNNKENRWSSRIDVHFDWDSGLIDETTPTVLDRRQSEFSIETLEGRTYRFYDLSQSQDDLSSIYRLLVHEEGQVSDSTPMVEFEDLTGFAIDGTQLAAFRYTPLKPVDIEAWGMRIDRNTAVYFDSLWLYGLRDPTNPKKTEIDIPTKLRNNGLPRPLQTFGHAMFGNDLSLPYLSLGDGILALWAFTEERVAVWDVSDPDRIRYLGMAPIPVYFQSPFSDDQGQLKSFHSYLFHGPTSPLKRPDGALGYVLPDTGPIWLSFPKRHKEPNS